MLQSYKFKLNTRLIKLIYWRVFDAALVVGESDGRFTITLNNRDQPPRDLLRLVYADAQTVSATPQHWLCRIL
jgi:hypothetical protein